MARTIAKDHSDKRRALLRAAAKVFATYGFDRASMNQVAQAAGVSKANIYHYYSSKDALLFDALDVYLDELTAVVAAAPDKSDAPTAQFRALITAILLAYEGMNSEHQLLSSGYKSLPADQQRPLRRKQRMIVDVMGETLTQIAPRALETDKVQWSTAMSVFAMTNWYYLWSPDATKADRLAYANQICDMVLNGISEG